MTQFNNQEFTLYLVLIFILVDQIIRCIFLTNYSWMASRLICSLRTCQSKLKWYMTMRFTSSLLRGCVNKHGASGGT